MTIFFSLLQFLKQLYLLSNVFHPDWILILSYFLFIYFVGKEMEDCCHVYQKDGEVYNAVLGMVDLAKKTNSYYKVQVLVHDSKNRYALNS